MLCVKCHRGVCHRPQGRQSRQDRGPCQARSSRGGRLWLWKQAGAEGFPVSPFALQRARAPPTRAVWEPQGLHLGARARPGCPEPGRSLLPLSACTSSAQGEGKAACSSFVTAHVKGAVSSEVISGTHSAGEPRGWGSPEPSAPGPRTTCTPLVPSPGGARHGHR